MPVKCQGQSHDSIDTSLAYPQAQPTRQCCQESVDLQNSSKTQAAAVCTTPYTVSCVPTKHQITAPEAATPQGVITSHWLCRRPAPPSPPAPVTAQPPQRLRVWRLASRLPLLPCQPAERQSQHFVRASTNITTQTITNIPSKSACVCEYVHMIHPGQDIAKQTCLPSACMTAACAGSSPPFDRCPQIARMASMRRKQGPILGYLGGPPKTCGWAKAERLQPGVLHKR